jgi:hypothetical protein
MKVKKAKSGKGLRPGKKLEALRLASCPVAGPGNASIATFLGRACTFWL